MYIIFIFYFFEGTNVSLSCLLKAIEFVIRCSRKRAFLLCFAFIFFESGGGGEKHVEMSGILLSASGSNYTARRTSKSN